MQATSPHYRQLQPEDRITIGGQKQQSDHGQSCNPYVCACGDIACEEDFENPVYNFQVRYVLDKNHDSDNVVHGVIDALDNGIDILKTLLGLLFNCAGHQSARFWIDWQLG